MEQVNRLQAVSSDGRPAETGEKQPVIPRLRSCWVLMEKRRMKDGFFFFKTQVKNKGIFVKKVSEWGQELPIHCANKLPYEPLNRN